MMLCSVCRQLRVLCKPCEEAKKRENLNRAEIYLSRLIAKSGKEASFSDAFDFGRKILLISSKAENLKSINFGKETLIFDKNFIDIETLFSPIKPKKTTAFLPGGKKEERLTVSRIELHSAGFDVDAIESAVKRLNLNQVRIV